MTSRQLSIRLGGFIVLFALNACFCAGLFRISYLDNLSSNWGALPSLAKIVARDPAAAWYPYWAVGLPIEHTYSPVAPFLTAAVARAMNWDISATLNRVVGVFFCLGPALWFVLASSWTGSAGRAFSGSALYSLISPVALCVPQRRTDLPHWSNSRRLWDVIHYGEVAHMLEVCLLSVAITAIYLACRRYSILRISLAAVASAATVLSDGFGMTGMAISCVALLVTAQREELSRVVRVISSVGALTLILVSPFLTPQLFATIASSSERSAVDATSLPERALLWIALLGLAWALPKYLFRRHRFARFMSFLGILCGGIAAIGGHWSINLLPFPGRYELEGDVGLAFAAVECSRYLSGRVLVYIAIIGSGAGCLQAARMFQFNRSFVRPIVIEKTPEYWCADWVNRHIPGQRVMISGDAEFWFNYFSDNPQMSGSHEPFSPNRAQQIAVFIIYSGLNAGSRDGEIAKTWLKAFGVTAISVPGNESLEPLHPFSRPDKFVGLLPSVASFAGDEMYSVPQRSSSLAHVIPNSAVVGQSPLNGLDTSLAEKYVAALDDPLLPMADMKWVNSGEAEIDATVGSNQVVSVQESYYPGWTAQLNGQPLRVDHDGLGLMLLRPPPGKCKIVLRFEGTHWRRSSLVLAQFALSGLLLASAWEFATERASGSGRTIRMG